MIRVNILKDLVVTNSATFGTEEQADTWISQEVANNSWGKPERWVTDIQEDVSNHTETRPGRKLTEEVLNIEGEVIAEETWEIEYKLPAQYTIEKTDVTAEAELAEATNHALQNQQLGAYIIARISAVNRNKINSGAMSLEEFNLLLADQTIANIERLLWNGSLATAKAMISGLDNTFYSNEEISSILAMIP